VVRKTTPRQSEPQQSHEGTSEFDGTDEEEQPMSSGQSDSESDLEEQDKKKKLPILFIPSSLKKGGSTIMLGGEDNSWKKMKNTNEGDSNSDGDSSSSSSDESQKKRCPTLTIPLGIVKGGPPSHRSSVGEEDSSSSSSSSSEEEAEDSKDRPKLGLALPSMIIKGGISSPSLSKAGEPAAEPKEETKERDQAQASNNQKDGSQLRQSEKGRTRSPSLNTLAAFRGSIIGRSAPEKKPEESPFRVLKNMAAAAAVAAATSPQGNSSGSSPSTATSSPSSARKLTRAKEMKALNSQRVLSKEDPGGSRKRSSSGVFGHRSGSCIAIGSAGSKEVSRSPLISRPVEAPKKEER